MSPLNRRILSLTAWLLSVGWVGAVAAQQSRIDADSSSLLETARQEAATRQFFGGVNRDGGTSSYFSRASDRTLPFSSSRFNLKRLTDRSSALPMQEHPLPLRSVSRHYGMLDGLPSKATTPSAHSRRPNPTASSQRALTPRGSMMGAEATARYQMANELKSMGYDFKWREHSLDELYGYRTRIELAERLQAKGVEVDWSAHTGEELARMAKYVKMGESLERNGRPVNWSSVLRFASPVKNPAGARSPLTPTAPPKNPTPLTRPARTAPTR